MKRIVLENLRSAYNVGNIVRTADALWRGVIWVGYTAWPTHPQVHKTALGAEWHIPTKIYADMDSLIQDYPTSNPAYIYIAAEKNDFSVSLDVYADIYRRDTICMSDLFVIVGNEVTWVEQSTLDSVHHTVHIPMLGIKESLNVWQAAAIFMWELQ